MERLTGQVKFKRDESIRKFAFEHPHYTQREIGEKFGLTRRVVQKALEGEKAK